MNNTKTLIASLSLLFLLFPTKTYAESLTITAIPPRVDLIASPGETLKVDLKVRNDSDNSIMYDVVSEDFIVYDKIGTPVPVNQKNNKWSLKSWLNHTDLVPVDANSAQVVPVTIRVPFNALPGGHYAMITYTPSTRTKPGETKKTASLVTQRVGSLIYITVKGKITEKATIASFTTSKFNEQGPVVFEGEIINDSNTHQAPKGNISIYSPLNQKIAELPVETGNIFPESSRSFTSTWTQKWGYGRYKADLNLVYGTAGSILSATIFFWLFPIRLVIYSLVALISVLVAIILLSKKGKKHQEELEKEVRELQREIKTLEKK